LESIEIIFALLLLLLLPCWLLLVIITLIVIAFIQCDSTSQAAYICSSHVQKQRDNWCFHGSEMTNQRTLPLTVMNILSPHGEAICVELPMLCHFLSKIFFTRLPRKIALCIG